MVLGEGLGQIEDVVDANHPKTEIKEMGSRFYLTGVQLGMLRVFAETENVEEALKVLKKIEEKQFLGDEQTIKKLLLSEYKSI